MIEILLVDAHQLVRQGLAALLAAAPDLRVVAQAGDGESAVRMARELRPAIVLMDPKLPGLGGIDATRAIAQDRYSRVLLLSIPESSQYVTAAIRAGAAGYLFKDAAADELVRAIRQVARGGRYIGPQIAGLLADHLVQVLEGDRHAEPGLPLSRREAQVLTLVAEGKASKQIAAALGLSTKTVENHRSRIKRKLGLGSVAELTQYAIRTGLIPLTD